MEEVSSDRWPETKSLRDDEKLYKAVEKLFISSIKRFSPGTTITSIHRCLHTTPSDNSHLLSFSLQKRVAMEARGNAIVKFEWHEASSSSIATIISQGFRKTNSRQLGLSSHGLDIHLSPLHSPYVSALLSEADEDGERHVMLCQIIMGNSEKVEAGSKKDHPSNEGFDSGIDDPVNPKWYVVWNTNMNKHIIPVYVVRFKSSSHSSGERKSMGARKLWNRPLCRLFTEIGMRLPSSKMQALEILYNPYRPIIDLDEDTRPARERAEEGVPSQALVIANTEAVRESQPDLGKVAADSSEKGGYCGKKRKMDKSTIAERVEK
ncbi:Inactive poly [ADP-ribose] polymerase RCD1 [Platanthera guangdongensis]|uniref:Inactive poly [ADP-ribose] polymerase RCD1 n=1 Tax=Platanthera guangdongensis TaxID=2320717 RepID=A0ABR2LVP6_9ASPA